MKKVRVNRKEISLKFLAIGLVLVIVISSISIGGMTIISKHDNSNEIKVPNVQKMNYEHLKRPIEIKSVVSEDGEWISFDNDTTPPGTPAEAHVTVSDTSGITIVADFYGFWRNEYAIDTIVYDNMDMPGTSSLHEYGKPMLPCLFEYVQIPYDIDVSIEVLTSSSTNTSGYNITPAPPPDIPYAKGESLSNASSSTVPTLFLDPVYSSNTFFPGDVTNTEGGLNSTSMIIRGHRLLGLSFYPVQYNPVAGNLTVYSQFVIKVKYSFPAQIDPVEEHLRSEPFERIIDKTVLNCYSSQQITIIPGVGMAGLLMIAPPFVEGAEYLIITNGTFEEQANRLAAWKEQKGMPSAVKVVPDHIVDVRQYVKNFLNMVYYTWFPAPTYVLLLGDVECIPANYDVDHESREYEDIHPDRGNIASDLGYFNIEGNGYFPDMIYGRMSVDTEMQAEIFVNKTLQYEQSPIADQVFYRNFLTAGYFEDRDEYPNTRDGIEDEMFPMIYTLERIRHYLNETLGYNYHLNYSCSGAAYDERYEDEGYYIGVPYEALEFRKPIYSRNQYSYLVSNSLPDDFVWLWGYDGFDWPVPERHNITANFDEGRFLVIYFGHGDSENMIYTCDTWPYDEDIDRDDRGLIEGWQHPSFNTSYFGDLTDESKTPLILSIACSTGWFDGETDQDYLARSSLVNVAPDFNPVDPYAEYANESFAEDITRLDKAGAIAVIAPSRIAYAEISSHLLNGIIQAIWPGHLGYPSQPIYEMGGVLLYGKLYAIREYTSNEFNRRRVTVEEYHLFGDPETQLWTDVPSNLTVEYPSQIGIGSQQFVVTVTNNTVPVSYAKVCLQKGSDIYQVGYTDPQGQVIFNVHPSYPGMMNLTVTKHNYVPHIGELECVCSGASLTLIPDEGPLGSTVSFNVHGFYDNEEAEIYYESEYIDTISVGTTSNSYPAPDELIGFVNVIAKGVDSNLVAIALYRCYSANPRPDPYIFSQWDESTWGPGVSGDDIGWYNPDIALYNDMSYPVFPTTVSPTITYAVWVKVHNQGDTTAIDTTVTLYYSEIGGGVSWSYAGEDDIPTIHVGYWEYAKIFWKPPKAGDFCLKAIIHNGDDKNLDNNVGVLAVNVVEYSSPGKTNFWVGNPTDTDHYVFICIRQQGNHSDVWNATIMDYSSQVIKSHENETISLQIDPGPGYNGNESRLFFADIYVKCKLVGGVSFKVSKVQVTIADPGIDPIVLVIVGGIGALVVLAVVVMKKKK